MPIPAEAPWGDEPPVGRIPGHFARHPKTGAPWVAHPTETTKRGWPGNKASLIVLCNVRGIAVPAGAKVADLQKLLGPCPKMVMYGRPSGLGKQIENTTNLQKWAERAVALGVLMGAYALSPADPDFEDCLALDWGTTSLDDDEAKDVLDEMAVKAKRRAQAGIAADRGTHTHELTELHDGDGDVIARITRGEELGLGPDVQYALVSAWAKMLGSFGIEILATEKCCVDDRWRQAGTLDRICRLTRPLEFVTATAETVTLPAGWVGILDIKTGKLRLGDDGFVDHWHSYAVQLASYAQSVPYDPDTDLRSTWEKVLES
jgi:hypothetical protein